MTVDTSEMVAQWREAIARGGHRAYSIPVVEMAALLDALEAERERVRVLEAENDEIRAANNELGEMFDLDPLRRASNEQIWAELDERCAPFAGSQKAADLQRERARLYREITAERERVRVLAQIGARIVESEVSRRPGLRTLAIEELRAALATAKGKT